MKLIDPQEPLRYASRFSMLKKKTAESYIQMAKIVTQAKHGLSKEQYGEFINLIGYDKSDSTIGKLYRIGLQADIFEQYIDKLPASFTTLYALTTAGEENLKTLFQEDQVRPSLKGSELSGLIKRQTRYRRPYPNRGPSEAISIDIDERLTRGDELTVRVLPGVTQVDLVQLVKQLESLTKEIHGIKVQLSVPILKRLKGMEATMK
jgi:hypothetical protein